MLYLPSDSVDPLFFATPAIWVPGMEEEEWQQQLNASFDRSVTTSQFAEGLITPDDFADCLNDAGEEVYPLIEAWENGVSFGM